MSDAEEKKDRESREEGLIPTASSLGPEGEAIGQIGPYKLLRVLGEGGFGVVYLAQQERPVKRRVALKVIKPGMDSKQVIARFEAERQALALLDHPNIAYVFNAGTTEAQRPYFVMEYVKGVPITEHCDREKLNVEERLKLFVQVCEAVQHAHQKGIIHRDIKPSNIQVSIEGKKAVPKIIDFGVAKAISQPLTERTLITEHGQLIGTPEYMSPEQAEMTNQDIDTRSDIYSLGVVLYELLAGALPFDKKTFRQAAFGEIQRIIREEEPAKPSTKLSSLGEALTDVAKHRHAEPGQLCKIIRGDLDWIVLKTLEKDRTRRYETANGLARDIERHLSDEPVAAGPPSTVYRMKKFVRRNRTSVTAAAIVVAAVLVGLIVSTMMYFQAEQAREKEAVARAEAERQAKISQAVADFLQEDVLASVDPAKAKGPEVSVRYILDAASESMEDKFTGEPLVEASVRQTLGTTYSSLGKYEAAKSNLERAYQIRREQLGEGHPDTAASIFELGVLYHRQDHWDEAEPLYVKALEVRLRILGDEHPDTLRSMYYLAWLYWEQYRSDEAEPLLVKTLKVQRRVLGEDHPDTLASMFGLAYVYSIQSRFDEAEQLYLKAVEGQRRVLGEDHPETLRSTGALGELYSAQGRFDDAEPLYVKSLEGLRRVLGKDHPRMIDSMGDLCELYVYQERYDEAETLQVKMLEMQRRVLGLGEEHQETLASMSNLATLYGYQGRYDEAEPLMVKVLEVQGRVLGEEDPDTLYSMSNLATLYAMQGRYDEAEPLFVKVLDSRRRLLGEEHEDTLESMGSLADMYRSQGRSEEAETLQVKMVEINRRVLGEGHPGTLESMVELGGVYIGLRQYEEAESVHVKILEIGRRVLGEEHPRTLEAIQDLGELYHIQGRYDEAEQLYIKVVDGQRRVLGEDNLNRLFCMGTLAWLYQSQGRYDEAEELLVKVLEVRRRVQGDEHEETLGSMNSLASLYGEQGRYEEAEPLLVKVLEGRRRLEIEEDWSMAYSMYRLGVLYKKQERYDEAEPLLAKALEIARRELGEEQPWVLNFMNNLAVVYREQGRYEEAEPLFVKALETGRRVLGEEHSWVLDFMNNLGQMYRDQGRYAEAGPLYAKTLDASRRAIGEGHPDTQAIMDKLVEVYEAWGKPVPVSVRVAGNPHPADRAMVNVGSMKELNWVGGIDATGHKVYFGTDSNDLAILADVASPNYGELPPLDQDTMYYWRIDEVQPDGSIITGNVWSFSTGDKLGLTGWWKFDETEGSNARDSSGNGNDGTLNGTPTWRPLGGKIDGALDFDGRDDWVNISNPSRFDFEGFDFTWSARIKTTDNGTIIANCPSSGSWHNKKGSKSLFLRNGKLSFDVSWVGYVESTTSVNDGEWHHVVVTTTFETSGTTDTTKLYMDGTLVEAKTLGMIGDWNVNQFGVSGLALKIGFTNDDFPFRPLDPWFKGLIDDVRIYSYALSQEDVAAIYAGKEPGRAED